MTHLSITLTVEPFYPTTARGSGFRKTINRKDFRFHFSLAEALPPPEQFNFSISFDHENDSGVGQLAVRLTGELKKRQSVNVLPVKKMAQFRVHRVNSRLKSINTHRASELMDSRIVKY